MRLAVYLELTYRRDEDGLSTDRAFVRFVLAVGERFASLRLVGRLDPEPGRAPYALPEAVELAALPWYPSLRDAGAVLRALPRTLPAVWRSLDGIDAVWALGPHPMSIPIALCALARRRRLVLGVRQDFPAYARARAGRRGALAARALDAVFRLLARRVPTVVVGPALARRYPGALDLAVSLVPEQWLAEPERPFAPDGTVRLLSVGRLDPEKAPEALVDAVGLLRRGGLDARLTLVGAGPLEAALRERAGHGVSFCGYVAHGPELLALYRDADVFVHAARTEGLPQALLEAQAVGLPVVAAAVGGVPEAVSGLLVPPADAAAVADAVRRLVAEPELRQRLVREGRARVPTLEAQAARAAAFIRGGEAPAAPR